MESGALILRLIRKNQTLNNPGSNERIYGGDRLVLCGTKEQLKKAVQMLTGCDFVINLRTPSKPN
jgi:K+/H+ antiporter YhaU regulatory subunit KhtT